MYTRYRQKGLCKGYVFEWNIGCRFKPPKTKVSLSNEGKANVKNDVSWSSDLVLTCFSLSSFFFLSCCHAFPVTVSIGFLSAFVSFC